MTPDLMMVAGIVLALLALPSMISAWSEARPPRVGGILLVTGIALIATAVMKSSTPYHVQDLPKLFLNVIAGLIR